MDQEKREKVILHMDGDAFFVSVEMAKDPSLKGKAVVTGQERGIVSALSYEAKALGITRTMSIYSVRKNYPEVIVLSGDYASYAKYSKKMFDIVRRYADDVEEYSIDECFADLTGLDKPLKLSYLEIAKKIQEEVRQELDLSVTIGIAPNKVLAKVASKWQKPNGLTRITLDNKDEFLRSFPIEKIWGIGKSAYLSMRREKIVTAKDFCNMNEKDVLARFSKPYHTIWRELHGKYVTHVDGSQKTDYSSIQKTETFHPATNDKDFLLRELAVHIEDACDKARHYNLYPNKISFFLKKQDMEYKHCQFSLLLPTNSPEEIIKLVHEKFPEVYEKGALYRATGVTLFNLHEPNTVQASLFDEIEIKKETKADKFEALHKELDKLDEKFGKKVIGLAGTSGNKKGRHGSKEQIDRNILFL